MSTPYNQKNLFEIINERKEGIREFNPEVFDIPKYISENLKYDFFDWQKEAIENLLYFENPKSKLKTTPTHLMFNMATGSGKTMVMAATILYYYKKGYRHFIFFVNQNNIVDKTENNFIDFSHTKYLFKEKIVIDDKTINIKKVETFSDNPGCIEIKFTTVQKFYEDIHKEKENQTTLDDLQKKDLVLLADEAHHLNANTRNIVIQDEMFETELKGTVEEKEKKGWEHTIIEYVLKKYDCGKKRYKENNKNVLLEFTATIPDNNENIAIKYSDKIIYKFSLKEFLQAGYTKEINLIPSTLDKKERILLALIFNWYRHRIALKYNIPNLKPVILFRSKMIEESKKDHEEFLKIIENLSQNDFDFMKKIEDKICEPEQVSIYEMGKSRIEQVLDFRKKEKISFSEITYFIKQNFKEQNVIITNSKNNKSKSEVTSVDQEKLLNNLEDKDNHIRAIFTVKRLTEGWDVLNLFDIVRLNKGQNVGGGHKGKTPEATIQEKQLIGRGVRYYPFTFNNEQKNKRKFDDKLDHELRVLEELFYFTYDDPKNKAEHNYIIELKAELKKDGYLGGEYNKIPKIFKLKDSFKKENLYKSGNIWVNEQKDNPNRKKNSLEKIKNYFKKNFIIDYQIKSLALAEEEINLSKKEDLEKIKIFSEEIGEFTVYCKNIEKHIFYKAINIKAKEDNSFWRFEKLQENLEIESIDDLQKIDKLGNLFINVKKAGEKGYDNLKQENKLQMVLNFLDAVENKLKEFDTPKVGTEFKPVKFAEIFGADKLKSVEEKVELNNLNEELAREDWYILNSFYGTSEEESLIEFIKIVFLDLKDKNEKVFLLRNEEVYKIYDFEKGRGFQPDFLLFLEGKDKINYQVFIEPKGNQYLGADGTFKTGKEFWKEDFLEAITEKYGVKKVIKAENKDYKLVALPFYNKEFDTRFNEEFEKIK